MQVNRVRHGWKPPAGEYWSAFTIKTYVHDGLESHDCQGPARRPPCVCVYTWTGSLTPIQSPNLSTAKQNLPLVQCYGKIRSIRKPGDREHCSHGPHHQPRTRFLMVTRMTAGLLMIVFLAKWRDKRRRRRRKSLSFRLQDAVTRYLNTERNHT